MGIWRRGWLWPRQRKKNTSASGLLRLLSGGRGLARFTQRVRQVDVVCLLAACSVDAAGDQVCGRESPVAAPLALPRTTTTGQGACSTQWVLTEPISMPAKRP